MSTAEDEIELNTDDVGRDDIASDIAAAFAEHTEDTPPDPAAKPAAGRSRDTSGRFAEKAATGAAGAPAAGEAAGTPATTTTGATGAPAATSATPAAAGGGRQAPQSWGADTKAQFAALPPAIQDQVLKREADHDGVMRSNAQMRGTLESLDKATQPYGDIIQAAGGHEKAFSALLNAQRMLMTDPVKAIHALCNDLGVQIPGQLQRVRAPQGWAAPAQRQAPPPVDVNAMVRQGIEREMTQRDIKGGIEGFAARNPHFHALSARIEAIAKAGLAAGNTPMERLQHAYDQAAWADPAIRQQLQAEQAATQRAAAQARGQTGQARATAARAAAVSVKGAPGAAPAGARKAGNARASLDDDIRGAFAEHR